MTVRVEQLATGLAWPSPETVATGYDGVLWAVHLDDVEGMPLRRGAIGG